MKRDLIKKHHKPAEILKLNYKDIIDILPIYLSVVNQDLYVLFANKTLINDFGDAIGKPCHITYKNSLDRCTGCPVQKTFDDKKVHFSENCLHMLNGERVHTITYSVPIEDKHGEIIYVMELATNITKVKAIHNELSGLGESIALMSHGIKNILEGLHGGAYVVDEGIYDKDWKLVKQGWRVVKNYILDISGFTQNVLYASKKRTLRMEKVFPYVIVKQSVKHWKEKAQSLGVNLESEVNKNLPPVNLDSFSIQRMLNNLISNALEACSVGKKDAAGNVVVRADYYNEFQFKFEVQDNGHGIDEKTKKKIFKDFFSTKGSQGTGLGLPVVDKIVKEHKGKIEVESEPGKGTTFRIILKI
jgi:signal transduction histidine kinase